MSSSVLTTQKTEVAHLPTKRTADAPACYPKEYLIGYAFEEAEKIQIEPKKELKTIECESSFNQFAVGDHGAARNVAQFHKPTFLWLQKLAGKGYEDLQYEDAKAQITLLAWAIKHGYGDQWTCYKKVNK